MMENGLCENGLCENGLINYLKTTLHRTETNDLFCMIGLIIWPLSVTQLSTS